MRSLRSRRKRGRGYRIKNRSLAEQTYLNHLQACETNIYLANIKAYELSAASIHAQDYVYTDFVHADTVLKLWVGGHRTHLGWLDR